MVGKNAKTIREHIQNQLEEALASGRLPLRSTWTCSRAARESKAKENSRCKRLTVVVM